MSNYRRRLLMAALGEIQPSSSNAVTWGYLRSIIPDNTFIRKDQDTYKIYRNYDKDILTWGKLNEVIPQGFYFTIENDKIVINHPSDSQEYPHKDAIVTKGDLRRIFPVGIKVEVTDNEIYLTYDSAITITENQNDSASIIDLYKIVPKGIIFYIGSSSLVVSQEIETVKMVGELDISDENPDIPYSLLSDNCYVTLKDLFEIIPSGVKVTSTGFTYDNTLDYNDSTPVTADYFYSIFPSNKRIKYEPFKLNNNSDKVTMEDMAVEPLEGSAYLTWNDLRKYIPNGVVYDKNAEEKYYATYDLERVRCYDVLTDTITRKELSDVIPFGVSINESGEFTKNIAYPISLPDYTKPISKQFLHSIIPIGITIVYDDATGVASIKNILE